MNITASMVKELRELTGAGMMDCKKALVEVEGDVKKAIDWLREKGISKAAKKEGRTAADGLSKVVVDGNHAVIVEINSETDFVAKNDKFLALLDLTCTTLLAHPETKTVEEALALNAGEGTLNDSFINAVAIIGEKIALRRFELVTKNDDEEFGTYMHNGGTISACVVVKGGDATVAKDMAMQIASMDPTYVSRNDMPSDIVDHEREVQTELVKNDESLANKPEKVKAGIVEGRVSKALQDMCLVDQIFFKDQDLKCGQYLKNNNAEAIKFVKYKVGEGIEKKADDFAAEVAAMAK